MPKQSKTYGEDGRNEIKSKVSNKVLSSDIVDMVFDVYNKKTKKRLRPKEVRKDRFESSSQGIHLCIKMLNK